MTVTYSLDISDVNSFTVFKLMLRWRGSVFKVLGREGLFYFLLYGIVNCLYRYACDMQQKIHFEAVATYCEKYMGLIPTTFILGFYVSIVYTRWSSILNTIPWPDTYSSPFVSGVFIGAYLKGDEKSLLYRRSIMRYMIAASVMAMRDISMQVRKRFPTQTHVVDSGLLTKEEQMMVDEIESLKGDSKYWVPIQWCVALVVRARTEGRISSDHYADSLSKHINNYRVCIGSLLVADQFCIPLVYTQVVTLAVWSYFAAALFARQIWVYTRLPGSPEPVVPELDIYVPIFTVLQFVCLVGWLKVAQSMLNPLGEGDDDFELNAIIDRNLQVGLLMVDANAGRTPGTQADVFMDEDVSVLPHTEASKGMADDNLVPSVFHVEIPESKQTIVDPDKLEKGSERSSTRLGSLAEKLNNKLRSSALSRANSVITPDSEKASEPVTRKNSMLSLVPDVGEMDETGEIKAPRSDFSRSESRNAGFDTLETLEEEDEQFHRANSIDSPPSSQPSFQ